MNKNFTLLGTKVQDRHNVFRGSKIVTFFLARKTTADLFSSYETESTWHVYNELRTINAKHSYMKFFAVLEK